MRRRAVLGAAPLALAGCGFQLRRPPELDFRRIQLTGFAPQSPLEQALRRRIDASSTTRVVDAAAQADVVLEALADARERSVVASTAAAQVREIQLRTRFRFTVRTPDGRELIAPAQLLLSRDMSYNESVALGKQDEQAFLFRSMQEDIVSQVMRRLAAVRLPPGGAR